MTLVDHTQAADQGIRLKEKKKIWIPISFWFTKSAGAALPLISLQYHEVKLIFDIEPIGAILKQQSSLTAATESGFAPASSAGLVEYTSTTVDPKFKLWADFIFLDTPERRRFAQSSHEYLIEQLQTTGEDPKPAQRSHNIRLSFNHPCKMFAFQFIPDVITDASGAEILDPFFNGLSLVKSKYAVDSSSANPIAKVKLQLNGHERFAEREGQYFHLVQPWQVMDAVPTRSYAGMYSFCLAPIEHQPSGALNMSRVDNAAITFEMNTDADGNYPAGKFVIHAINYNVLRVLSGMGGLAFSN